MALFFFKKKGQRSIGYDSPAIRYKPQVEAALRCYRVLVPIVMLRNEASNAVMLIIAPLRGKKTTDRMEFIDTLKKNQNNNPRQAELPICKGANNCSTGKCFVRNGSGLG
ncbi:hypothetical protein [Mucilaginibacter sp.]|uniref:hypothetical protein n=1 Tax=Mucilaginibacter sp. TaxID=1882438 RepID=UPI0032653A31